jgi:hypothetical protein
MGLRNLRLGNFLNAYHPQYRSGTAKFLLLFPVMMRHTSGF